MSNSLSITSTANGSRRRYPVEYKRQVVQESLRPSTSIANVAMAHGINANMLHNWRWHNIGAATSDRHRPVLRSCRYRYVPVPMPQSRLHKSADLETHDITVFAVDLNYGAGFGCRGAIRGAFDMIFFMLYGFPISMVGPRVTVTVYPAWWDSGEGGRKRSGSLFL